jgi:predicted ATPase
MSEKFILKMTAVENFKAVQKSGNVVLTPVTAFIGNNGSGKSSLIEAMQTYRGILLGGLDSALDRWHGLEYVWNKRATHDLRATRKRGEILENPVSFHFKGIWGRGAFNVQMVIAPTPGRNAVRIDRELLKLPEGRLYRREADGRVEVFNDHTFDRVRRVEPGESAAPQDWVQLVQRWQFLALDPAAMGDPTRQRLAGGPAVLEPDGSNLGQYLWSLREASLEAYNGVLEALQYVLPYARDVQTVVTQAIERLLHLEMTEEGFKVPGWLLSTGTLRVLALLACLRHPDPPPLLVVEEIENGLDPRTLHLIVEEIRAAVLAGTTQVILTTHSPYLLDLLDLSHVVVVERVDSQPTFLRPDQERLAAWSKTFSPGRLYTMGRLTQGD